MAWHGKVRDDQLDDRVDARARSSGLVAGIEDARALPGCKAPLQARAKTSPIG
jgi:hypothetical protein